MKLLAIDTATEQCSAAVLADDALHVRATPTARGHADLILPMIDELLRESGLTLRELDALAFGRGPGSFTGVRIAVGVVQGLALAGNKPVIGISNLAAVAQQAAAARELTTDAVVLVCMDARMNEVYSARYRVTAERLVELIDAERVVAPSAVTASADLGVGTGWLAYPELRGRYSELPVQDRFLPRAQEIAILGQSAWRAGRVTDAARAQPVYLRDNVVGEG